MIRGSLIALAVALGLLGGSCTNATSDEPVRPTPVLDELPYPTLSEYGFFTGPIMGLAPAPGVIPYTVASPLWSDQSEKGRFILLPEGERIAFTDGEDWGFPVGTIIIKTFFFDLDRRAGADANSRIIETRLLIQRDDGWSAHTYVWNEEQTEAELRIAGGRLTLEYVDEAGATQSQLYQVPNDNECGSCHERSDEMHLLGLVTEQLNRTVERDGVSVNQIEWLASLGIFQNPPSDIAALDAMVPPFGDAPLAQRARDYLHVNCAHCHRPGGGGGRSGLSLLRTEDEPHRFGVCKGPVAAGQGSGGLHHDIVPAQPDESIMVYRMESTDPEVKMPELPNRVPHAEGIALVREWIAEMEPRVCGE